MRQPVLFGAMVNFFWGMVNPLCLSIVNLLRSSIFSDGLRFTENQKNSI